MSLKLHLTGKRTDDGNRIWCILGWNVTNVVYLLVDPGFLCPLNFYKASRSVPPPKMDASDRHNGQTNACPSDGVAGIGEAVLTEKFIRYFFVFKPSLAYCSLL